MASLASVPACYVSARVGAGSSEPLDIKYITAFDIKDMSQKHYWTYFDPSTGTGWEYGVSIYEDRFTDSEYRALVAEYAADAKMKFIAARNKTG